ncbi:hypothetical protein EVAR_69652_1 [Eumeta japonica]|uniref:Uncharacterized protein n=1 Tax=Eumeta variegata TaxID=151549 RepID=A0A4C1SIN4_EUMVA|nr:hypothetical protein EVAR_69652_1 [Eumeta japonica]
MMKTTSLLQSVTTTTTQAVQGLNNSNTIYTEKLYAASAVGQTMVASTRTTHVTSTTNNGVTQTVVEVEKQKSAPMIIEQEVNSPPPLPKTTPPPTVPRKVYRQDLVVNVEDIRAAITVVAVPAHHPKAGSPSYDGTTPTVSNISSSNDYKRSLSAPRRSSDWRKDEKSEKSVRDKIAIFSNEEAASTPSDVSNKPFNFTRPMNAAKPLNLSTENLLDSSTVPRYTHSSNLHKTRAMSVENLNDVSRHHYHLPKPLPAHSGYSDSMHSLNT